MAASSQQRTPLIENSGASGPSVLSPRWSRSGEPSSAFSGLSRGGKNRGNGRGRSGRGGRGGGATREGKSNPDGDKPNTVTTTKTVSTPAAVSKPPALVVPHEKASTAPVTAPSKPKGPSRRASRTIPSVLVAQPSPPTDAPPTPTASRPQNRRRRSHSGKSPVTVLPKINVPPHDDLARPQRNRIPPAPHSAPAKDTPPHLMNSFGMRNNIDALVERVRAVAMAENRPTTPGSHIDWAGDDDDSLPDLDDWGVTSVSGIEDKNEMISPIIVDGLKPLPELVPKPLTASHSNQKELAALPTIENHIENTVTKSSGEEKLPLIPPFHDKRPDLRERGKAQNIHLPQALSLSLSNDNAHADTPITSARRGSSSTVSNVSAVSSGNVLHPSLPAKPMVTAEAPATVTRSWHGSSATPMRNPSPKTPTTMELPRPVESVREHGIAQSIHAPSSTQATSNGDPFTEDKPRDGLTASIHAPQRLSDSLSAPSTLVSHSSALAEPRLTHTRAHTVGRPPSFPRAEYNVRPSRSGYSTPKGEPSSGGYHARTHSSPPAGSILNHRTSHSRPVITGDAISKLARTIGNTTASPARAAGVTTSP